MARRLVVVGGDAGGMGAATQARRLDPSLEITAFERTEFTSYSACGIPYVVAGEVDDLDRLVARSPQEHRDRSRIDVRTQHEVMGIDLDARRLEVRDHAHGRTITAGFDVLMLATGARPVRPDLPGIDLPSVHGVQTLSDAQVLLAQAEQARCRNAVVVGGGYIGLELAEAFVRRGAKVTVVEGGDHVMRTLDADMARPIEDAMRAMGIELLLGVTVTGFGEREVQAADRSIETDVAVLGLGVAPATMVARDAGIELGVEGSIRVDRRQRASADGVYAAGDCTESHHLVTERPVYFALGTLANRQARVAGINIGGGYATFPGVLGTAVTRICDTEIARTGLTERGAADAGFVCAAGAIDSTTTSRYMPGSASIRVKLVAEKGTGRLLGGQIVGGKGAAKRIDVVATAITARMDLQQVVDLDLGYAPPFGPLWDPVATAARQLLNSV